MITLGIESSCDETSVAVVENCETVRANVILSQLVHAGFGGVVPELASREHLKAIMTVYEQALAMAHIKPEEIDLIAATYGPGLVGALLVGLNFGTSFSYSSTGMRSWCMTHSPRASSEYKPQWMNIPNRASWNHCNPFSETGFACVMLPPLVC